jgi:hypothetical protein
MIQLANLRWTMEEMKSTVSDEAFAVAAAELYELTLKDPNEAAQVGDIGDSDQEGEGELLRIQPGDLHASTRDDRVLLDKTLTGHTFATLTEYMVVFPKSIPRCGVAYIRDPEDCTIVMPVDIKDDAIAKRTECSVENPSLLRVSWHPAVSCGDYGCYGCDGGKGDLVGEGTRGTVTFDNVDWEGNEEGQATTDTMRIQLRSLIAVPGDRVPVDGVASIPINGTIKVGDRCVTLSGHERFLWGFRDFSSDKDFLDWVV